MNLGTLIAALKEFHPDVIVSNGFGEPHSDRGNYNFVAFDPMPTARIGDMLAHAESALDTVFEGYKGGEYGMDAATTVRIGEYGSVGEDITPTSILYWEVVATMPTSLPPARRTLTIMVDCVTESAEAQFQEMLTDCENELVSADRETLTLRFRQAE